MSSLKDSVPAVDSSGELEASSVSKATPGFLVTAFGRIDSTAATAVYYVQFLNAAALPGNGTVTFLTAPIKINHTTGTDSTIDLDLKREYIAATTGIVWCISSTEFTKTITGAVASITLLYK